MSEATTAPTTPDGATFTELVYAHYEWWKASRNGGTPGASEHTYHQVLNRFERKHGRMISSFWCSHIESSVALTEQPRRFPFRARLAFHRETDWATKRSPEIAAQFHHLDDLAIRARTVLTGVRQQICLHRVASSAGHLLSLVDTASAPQNREQLTAALEDEAKRIKDIQDYYDDAANGQAQIVYFSGMAAGAILIGLLAGLFLIHVDTWQAGVAALVAGAVGAVVSVIQRINNRHFKVAYDVGRPYAFFLGGLRPLIGGAFAIAVSFAFDSGIIHLPIESPNPDDKHLALVVVSFLAGFSERWAQDTLATALPQARADPPVEPAEK
jgi:hypothetical protein